MKLRKLAISNIKHNFRKYMLYFLSLCFSVFTAYTFLGLMNSESVAFAFEDDTRYKMMLAAFGIIIGVFVFLFHDKFQQQLHTGTQKRNIHVCALRDVQRKNR